MQEIDYGWHEEVNDPTPFIKYILQMLLASYREFEERVGVMEDTGVKSSAYDVVKFYVGNKLGKFTPADVLANCPSMGRTSASNAIKKLTEEGYIEKCSLLTDMYCMCNFRLRCRLHCLLQKADHKDSLLTRHAPQGE